ncbi:hypothetical protein P9695_15595 [Weizmannia sp. CD-2023]|uniref:hypothetical protein n=1 Tax=Heyndrickxia TaxID=2837504 RepID=UPI0014594BE5|nr:MULTISPECIES: hypothetical protein [Heyndrickxia]MED4841696.1 hypothetical protein [Weizmannia sp. CD-2023]MED4901027.1 hypothetical protein [Weizmannia sp. CD-2023]NMH83117.1 hypothetical protein [Heyndrickxia coagulans]
MSSPKDQQWLVPPYRKETDISIDELPVCARKTPAVPPFLTISMQIQDYAPQQPNGL